MVARRDPSTGVVHPTFSYPGSANTSMLQGFYMASPAVDVVWLLNLSSSSSASSSLSSPSLGITTPPTSNNTTTRITSNTSNADILLQALKPALERFTNWLWLTHNSSTGVLWLSGTADTGEDGSDKYQSLPDNKLTPPFANMDMMGYA